MVMRGGNNNQYSGSFSIWDSGKIEKKTEKNSDEEKDGEGDIIKSFFIKKRDEENKSTNIPNSYYTSRFVWI